MASVFGLCLLARPLEPIRLAMSPRGSLRAVAASALLASVAGALLVLLPALATSGALLDVRGLGLGAGIATAQVAGLGLAAWTTTRNPTRQPMVFLAMAWLVPSCLGERIGPLVSGAWVATPAQAAPLAALGGVALVWAVAIASAPAIRSEGVGSGEVRERRGAAR
ncbi:MAG TPA: hypothetical protein VJP77_08450 [Planctomycetota bacterium]|nr:hypothetical protein [Planctomycetota bacterium]